MLLALHRRLIRPAAYPVSSLFSFNHHLSLRRMSNTKTIAVLDESELQDGQMKEVAFEDGKVLLSKLGDKIHATSAFCTHYGAPLAKGVLTADGRVVCPWHGACFSVCTGDIEDAPAPTALHSFKAHVADGKIHVTANAANTTKANMSRQPKLLASGTESSGRGVVIIGGGSGTFHAVESLREHGYSAPITVLSKETHTPIDRTKLSKALIVDPAKIEWRNAADLKIKYGTNLRLGVEVTGVDLKQKFVTIDGRDTLPYDKLIIAPGGTPRRLPIEGANLDNVFTFRGIFDSQKVDNAAKEGKRAVVIGSSFISMELVAAMSKRKLASIDVIGMEEVPFQNILGKEIGAALQKYHESQGVKFHMQSKIDKIVAAENSTLANGVVVNGETLPADFVIMGVGVAPATEFLKGSGLEIEKDGGIKVNEYLRVKSGPDTQNVYAIGDVAIYPQHTGGEVRIEHWNVAGNHGRAVGSTISGKEQPFVKVPVFWSAQGQQLRYCGVGHQYDRIIVKGSPEDLKFIAYYVKNDKIVAVASMQNDPVVSKASELLRLGLMPTPQEVEAGKDLLTIDIATSAALAKVE
ncbi:flavo protein [Ephemerocybe angulata]|uniref:Flavo protein n=1 Tax=Ephemerocybe angulata TaxID=980116 RepID=A0A8H6MAM9_9AGAR|nr:flavo protein [Tulosesus angulatus]